YKAQRPETPDALKVQSPWAPKICDALGLPSLSVEGFEADALLATLAAACSSAAPTPTPTATPVPTPAGSTSGAGAPQPLPPDEVAGARES
ncbi:MAG: hypothetical protein ACE5IL_03980, partial [Myxococcota bacterium]